MRSLSFADQVYSLGMAAQRYAAEREEQQRASVERTARLVAARGKRAPKNPKEPTPAERILAVMVPATAYRWGELQAATGLGKAKFSAGMTFLLKKRRIDKTPDLRSSVYSLPC